MIFFRREALKLYSSYIQLVDTKIFIVYYMLYYMVKSIRPSDGNKAQNLFFRPTD